MKEAISTTSSPAPVGPYSQGILTETLVFVAGQGPMDPATKLIPEGIEKQTHQVLQNIRSILVAGGASMKDVLKATVHLANLGDFDAFNRVYTQYFREPYPVRTTVGSGLLGILVEIDVIALRPVRTPGSVADVAREGRRVMPSQPAVRSLGRPAATFVGETTFAADKLLRLWNARLQALDRWLARSVPPHAD